MKRPHPYSRSMHQRVFFAAFGFGPYECFFCHGKKGPVTLERAFIHHIDNNPHNNHPYNLVATHGGCHASIHNRGRRLSARTRGRMSRAHMGKANLGAAKLSREQVLEIRARYDAGESPTRIGTDYGISQSHTSRIGLRKGWRHLEEVSA